MTRIDQVLAHLLSGKTLTQGEGILLGYGTRIAVSINRLRERGHSITTKMKEDIHGYPYAEYSLVTRNRHGDRKRAA